MIKIISGLTLLLILSISCSNSGEKNSSKTGAQPDSISKKSPDSIAQEENQNSGTKADTSNMLFFPSGKIIIGSTKGSNRHQPPFETDIDGFYLDKFLVSVAQFEVFVNDMGYITEAEKFGDSGIFDFKTGTWNLVKGTYWKYPLGPANEMADPSHPVTHVSWNDANEYASWAGKRLPNEFEWEYAAKNMKSDAASFPWGETETKGGSFMANTWQGESATAPSIEDGFLTTSPLGSFAPSEAGLYDMSGNVWEWCSNTFRTYPGSSFRIQADENVKAIRGGSFMYDQLGAESYSVYGRSFNTTETSLFNTGFRCAK